jgi:hypothetical protein
VYTLQLHFVCIWNNEASLSKAGYRTVIRNEDATFTSVEFNHAVPPTYGLRFQAGYVNPSNSASSVYSGLWLFCTSSFPSAPS